MIEKLKNIVEGIHRNLDIYLTILVGIIVAILDIAGVVSSEIVGAATLATLSLLASSLLASRRSVTELRDATTHVSTEIRSVEKALRGKGSLSDFLSLTGYPDLSEEFRRARRISILGTTLISTIVQYNHEFTQLLERGGSLRYLLPTPNPENIAILAFRSNSMPTVQAIENAFQGTMTRLETLTELCGDTELLQVRTIPYVQPYGIVVVEGIDGELRVYAKLMAFRVGKLPYLDLNSPADKAWTRFFAEQFEKLWAVSTAMSFCRCDTARM